MRKSLRRELFRGALKKAVIPSQPPLVRFCHWGFAVSISGLLVTGFELHQPAPFLAVQYGQLYVIHMVFCWFSLAFFALRVADVIVRQDTSMLATLKDVKDFPRLLAYYFFLRATPPPAGKYNSGQKLVFTSWFIVFLLGSLLGFSSYYQGEHLTWVIRITGGVQMLRWIKYAFAVYLSATIALHIYLSLTQDLSRLQAMLTGYERKGPKPKSP